MDTPNTISSQERIAGLLAYILFFIPMLMGIKTEFSMFHAKQSIILLCILILAMFIPFIGGIISAVVFIVSLWCMYQSYLGNKFVIPYIGENMNSILTQVGLIGFFSVK